MRHLMVVLERLKCQHPEGLGVPPNFLRALPTQPTAQNPWSAGGEGTDSGGLGGHHRAGEVLQREKERICFSIAATDD